MGDRRSRLRGFGIAALAGAIVVTASTVVADPAAAESSSTCTVRGSLPARVSIGHRHTAVRTVLEPSGSCLTSGREDSAAYLYRADTPVDVAVWSYFGEAFSFDFVAGEAKPGTYRLTQGVVLLEDPTTGEWVDFTWADTSTVAKYTGRVAAATTARTSGVTTIRALVQSYRPAVDAYRGLAGATVYVDRAHTGQNDWTNLGRRTSDSSGHIALAHHTSGHWDYRVRLATTPTVWGNTTGRLHR